MALFFKPSDGWAGDFIPFYWQGDYHLFYLKDYRNADTNGQGTPWFHLVTRDFVNFEDWGEAIPRGPEESHDLWIYTGCVMEHNGIFHIFYTGHNKNYLKIGKPQQVILHATSPDLRTWHKDPDFSIFAPVEQGYEFNDWRDPFVFWSEEDQAWLMLLAARKSSGPDRNRGLVACLTSPDLQKWSITTPFWEPDLYFTHECPDVFKIREWWYLVWSEFSDRKVTRYRMSRSLKGPWLKPADDAFDTRAFYAAKTGSDGQRRFAFGWLASRQGETDTGEWQWGGDLVVHEITPRPDGTLAVRVPETVLEQFNRPIELVPQPVLGTWQSEDSCLVTSAEARFSALLLADMPGECLVEATVQFSPGTAACGVLLRASGELNQYYQVRLEPAAQRIVVDLWPRPGDKPFVFERPLALQPDRPVRLRCLTSGTNLVVYVDDETALSCRMYDHPAGSAGLFAIEGTVQFSQLAVRAI
ncbi:MAG: hypothetical protein JWP00_1220 [Chloroflexi bacterium]|jgi:beta-fructofuranosidase|nr:hypothetical protein [Chloroflexota bacterium]